MRGGGVGYRQEARTPKGQASASNEKRDSDDMATTRCHNSGEGALAFGRAGGTGDATREYIMLAREGAHGMEMRVTINERDGARIAARTEDGHPFVADEERRDRACRDRGHRYVTRLTLYESRVFFRNFRYSRSTFGGVPLPVETCASRETEATGM